MHGKGRDDSWRKARTWVAVAVWLCVCVCVLDRRMDEGLPSEVYMSRD